MKTRLWFKRRRYGYGWTPVTWQGWIVIGVFLLIVLIGALSLVTMPGNPYMDAVAYLSFVALLIFCLVMVAIRKGPSPKWRWGKKNTDDPKEDF